MTEVVLVGTSAADGWPNPFCRCASCCAHDAPGLRRTPTAALLDDVLLLDCGTGVPAAALAAGRPLDRLRALLLTHDHPDHSAPMALLARSWVRSEPLRLVGPDAVLDTWRPWCGPDDPVRFTPVSAGDVLDVEGYRVQVLEADHDQPAVLYAVEAPDGARVLYATDTGPLPASAVDALAASPVDLVLLEETFGDRTDHGTRHLDLGTFPRELARLRRAGALRAGAGVVAVHLSHHNPPEPRLTQRLAVWGARPGRDGEVLTVRAPAGATEPVRGGRQPARASRPSRPAGTGGDTAGLPRRTLVLGGARSGKSTAAERLLAAYGTVTYVATGHVPGADGTDVDAGWAQRVDRHRAQRPSGWLTVETADAAAALRDADGPVLLDCLGTWLTRVLDEAGAWDDAPGWARAADDRVADLLDAWRAVTGPVVAVTNEVGSGVVPATAAGSRFRDHLGRLNQRVADASEQVLLVVAGRALDLGRLSGPTAPGGGHPTATRQAP
ncbi:bifunctional adenosylcobinamide kinase/adenosylcobinamide-phosphate guanylyltransferase [Thalassiella azotivora]